MKRVIPKGGGKFIAPPGKKYGKETHRNQSMKKEKKKTGSAEDEDNDL